MDPKVGNMEYLVLIYMGIMNNTKFYFLLGSLVSYLKRRTQSNWSGTFKQLKKILSGQVGIFCYGAGTNTHMYTIYKGFLK